MFQYIIHQARRLLVQHLLQLVSEQGHLFLYGNPNHAVDRIGHMGTQTLNQALGQLFFRNAEYFPTADRLRVQYIDMDIDGRFLFKAV